MADYKFPDEVEKEAPADDKVEFEVEGESEIEVVDDTPEADRGRKPMKEPPAEVTDDFAWYELTQMANEMRALASRFANMERVLKSRSVDQRRYVDYLESKVRMLKALVPQEAKE